jgi:ribonuclease T1
LNRIRLLLGAFRRALGGRGWMLPLFFAALLVVVWSLGDYAKQSPELASDDIALSELPHNGREVYAQIHRGEPFSHTKDGSVFGNRERLLPLKKRGFYREYTVRTPNVKHRGARRIVCGGWEVSQPEVCYYTVDHYASFRRIVP